MALDYLRDLKKANDNKGTFDKQDQLLHMQRTMQDSILAEIKNLMMMTVYSPHQHDEVLLTATRAAMIVAISFIAGLPDNQAKTVLEDMDVLIQQTVLKK